MSLSIANNGKVISIEPEPHTFEMLKTNIALNNLTNVYPINLAAWNKNEVLPLFVPLNKGISGTSTLVKELPGTHVKIGAMTVDDILSSLKIETVNCIKVDAEGAEPEIFEGLTNTIAKSNSLKILFESWDDTQLERCGQVLKKLNMTITAFKISHSRNFLAEKVKEIE